MKCLLCLSNQTNLFFERTDKRYGKRAYWICSECRLIFLSPQFHLSLEEEKARYDTHQNRPEDEGYISFLNRLAEPLSQKLKKADMGLDYGCGPGPTLNLLLEKKGFCVKNYDPIYFPDEAFLKEQFDFVTCTETIEHFHSPLKEFQQLDQLLKEGGCLGVMTEVLQEESQFPDWWYHKDPTHVCFYQKPTLEWIAHWQNWKVLFPAKNITLFFKSS